MIRTPVNSSILGEKYQMLETWGPMVYHFNESLRSRGVIDTLKKRQFGSEEITCSLKLHRSELESCFCQSL